MAVVTTFLENSTSTFLENSYSIKQAKDLESKSLRATDIIVVMAPCTKRKQWIMSVLFHTYEEQPLIKFVPALLPCL